MILSGAFEFEKSHNSEVVNRPSDNEELPPVSDEWKMFHIVRAVN